jgi:hypothetical protein
MTDRIETIITGGQFQGVAGAGMVNIENFTIYNRPAEEPTPTGAEPIPPCPYPGLAYFGPDDADLFFGRDGAVARLAEALNHQSFLPRDGRSGARGLDPALAEVGRLDQP